MRLRTYCSFTIVLTLVFSDFFIFLEHGLLRAPQAEAAAGDFSIFREAAGGDVVTSAGLDLTWDTAVTENSNITLAGNDSDITLSEGGKYLVLYNTWIEEGSAGGANRRSLASYLTLDGIPLEYGWGGGYIRDGENNFTAYNSGAAIIDTTAAQNLQVVATRDDTNSGAGSAVRGGTNGVSVLKLDDSLQYLRVHASNGSSDISSNTNFTSVAWDTLDEVDTGSFDFSPSSADITLKGGINQFFLVTANVKVNVSAASGPRQNYEMRLTIDGAEVPGTRSNTYLRFDQGTVNGTMQYVGVIKKTAAGDQNFNVEVRREGVTAATTNIVGDETALAMVALPASANVLSLTNTATQALTSDRSVLNWNNQITTASSFFTHSTVTNNNNIEIAADGDYLFFASTYITRTGGTQRDVPRAEWQLNSSVLNYGGHGSFTRGIESGENTFASGASSGLILPGLTSGDIVELLQSDETTGTPVSSFAPNRVALQALEISSLIAPASTNVIVTGNQPATTSPSVNGFELGEKFAIIENNNARNIINLTLTESGTIDAETDLDAVRLYYDLDETAPYDCSSESYNGDESQYGATTTFNGANGTVSFSDSLTINQTRTFCGYVVFNITSSARDKETINILMSNPVSDVAVTSGGTVSPPSSLGNSETIVENPEITQTGYHWRNDDGNEAGATSATDGNENTPGLSFSTSTPQRLRLGVAALGTGIATKSFRLEYAEKVSSCEVATGWNDVGASAGAWDMFDSSFLTEGSHTSNISTSSGGVSDGADQFIVTNAGIKDTSSQVSVLTISNSFISEIAEFSNSSVTNGLTTTINLTNTYVNPVVVASVRYPQTGTQRTPRISNKTSTSFDILIDNYNGTLAAGNTSFDYYVMEAGDWIIDDGGTGTRIFATSTLVSVVDGRALPNDPGGTLVTYPSAFTSPTVLATVVTSNDPDWLFASVYDGINVDNKPLGTSLTVFLNENWDEDGHTTSEEVDIVVFEESNGTNNEIDFDFTTSGAANVPYAPTTISYSSPYSAVPGVIIVQALTQIGSDGGYAFVDTNTAPTASAVTISSDEEGATAGGIPADRTHASEEVAIISFATSDTFAANRSDQSQFTELEYSIQATNDAVEGVAYCFRVTDAGEPLRNYLNYPEATLSADVTVSTIGAQVATVSAGDNQVYSGGAFVIKDNIDTNTVTEIVITETGTVDASAYLSDIELYYESDNSAPFDCSDESYDGDETQFGVTDSNGFSAANGTSTFIDSVAISATSALCVYLVYSVEETAANGDTIAITISNPSSDVSIAAGSVGPGSNTPISGATTIQAASLRQANYHWRNDDGDEAGATSASAGLENTPITQVFQNTTRRIRFAISNDGGAPAVGAQLRLEYGTKVFSCDTVGSWQRVDSGAAFNMDSTSQLVDGDSTANISEAIGGVSNPNDTFLTPNGAEKESSDQHATTSLTTTEYLELEYAIAITEATGFSTTYCFRLTDAGEPLNTYTNYPELTIQDRQDFIIQRGTETVSGTSTTLIAGVDYDAPSSTSSAFIRITNTSMTGAGSDTRGQELTPDQLTAYIEDPNNLQTSFTITRPVTAIDNTRVSWEIIEYVGISGGDNEIIVRDASTITYAGSSLFATGTVATGVVDATAVAVIITGQINPATITNDYNTGLSISSWSPTSSEPVFQRGDADGVAAGVSYAVVEFVGANWKVQRAEHTFTTAGVTETKAIAAVNSLERSFVHAQKISGDELFNLDESGHEVWLSSIGAVSFQLENNSTNPGQQTSVAWVIENTQTGEGAMNVYRSNGSIAPTTVQPNIFVYPIGATVVLQNSTIWASNRTSGPGDAHPRALLGARILNETQFELWKSDEGQTQSFRVAVVDWPVAETSIRQTHYRFYVDNDNITPTDPWPLGPNDMGENSPMTDLDEPLGQGERTRIRTALFINNASLAVDSTSFKLQYGRRVTSCSAVSVWDDLGDINSGAIWRGHNALPVDGSAVASTSLLLSVSDVAGSYEEENPTAPNPAMVDIAEYIEYDWLIEHNGALQKNSYCFRMVESDGAELDGYDVYPTVRTSGYTPVVTNWRWYDDENSSTPVVPVAAEEVAPSDVSIGEIYTLRIALTEIEGAPGSGIKFNLQYSEYADFRDGGTVLTATSSCDGNSLWCYADGFGEDNDSIENTVLSGVDSCVSGVGVGCGTRNQAEGFSSAYNQAAFSTSEHQFTLQHAGARVGAVYYFRPIDATNGATVFASSSYPSLLTEGAVLTFSVSGISAATTIDNLTTDTTTTPTDINLGSLPLDTDISAAQRLTVFTNGTEGYRVLMQFDQNLLNSYGVEIASIASSNANPVPWSSACTSATTGCFGYHVSDDVLYGGSIRFALDDTFAGIESEPVEVMGSSVPVTFDTSEVVFRTRVNALQPAGDYVTNLQYIVVPVF